MNRKGAIELSANFIIVMIISMVILAGGLGLFFKLKNSAQQYVDTLDGQTESKIKSIMLNNNYRVAVYPQDPNIEPNNAEMIGIGITNIYPEQKTFTIELSKVTYYAKDNVDGVVLSDTNALKDYYDISSTSLTIGPNTQVVKGVLLKMPEGVKRGQHVYTITVRDSSASPSSQAYGVVQVYATN
ncbi:MAG TPA: hypothetical protein V6C58_10990 [Allocoleopsis sp.]